MKLKNIVPALCLALGLHSFGFAQQSFNYEIAGKFPGAKKVLLSADMFGGVILDSAQNKDGSYSFKGKANKISLGTLIVESEKYMFTRYFNLFIEPGKVSVKLYEGGRQIEPRGTKNNNVMSEVEAQNRDFWKKAAVYYDTLNYASMKMHDLRKAENVDKDSITYYTNLQQRMEEAAAPLTEARAERLMLAFKKYPNSYFTAYTALNSANMTEETLKNIYAGFDDNMKNSDIGKQWKERVFNVKRVVDGSVAPEFAGADVNGKEIKLSDFKGKYVLLDFWATWCGPCRAGNPHLIGLYNKYKDQGLAFVGISDDDANVAGWKKAIKDDGIGIWPQVLRNRNKKNASGNSMDIAELYDVSAYPTKILIDKEGKIIHQFANDKELEDMLATLFKS